MVGTDVNKWLFTELFDRVPNNIAIIDRQFRIVETNRNFVQTFGESKGKLCHEIYRDSQTPCPSCKAELTFMDGKGRVSEERRLNRHGRRSYYVVHFEPVVDPNGEIPYIIEMSARHHRAAVAAT